MKKIIAVMVFLFAVVVSDAFGQAKIYIAGSYKEGEVSKACYWENGTRTDLTDGKGNSSTSAIAVVGSDVYVSGWYEEDGVNKACYWKNNTRIDLPGGGTYASSIAVAGSDVYVAGYDGDIGNDAYKAYYWKNSTRIDLPDGKRAHSIAVVGLDVYVAGSYNENGNYLRERACYWKNNTIINLPGFASAGEIIRIDGKRVRIEEGSDGQASSIAVVGSDVYVAGQSRRVIFIPCYWKNGNRIELPYGGEREATYIGGIHGMGTHVNSIKIVGSDVYVAGSYEEKGFGPTKACYWKNNTRIDLSGGGAYASSIAVAGSDVYVAGSYQEGDIYKACYWKNDIRIDLPIPAGATSSSASSIEIKE